MKTKQHNMTEGEMLALILERQKQILELVQEINKRVNAMETAPADKTVDRIAESDNEYDDDELYEEVKAEVIKEGKASTSFLQRKFRIGYGRAARMMDLLEEKAVIGPADGARPRKVLL